MQDFTIPFKKIFFYNALILYVACVYALHCHAFVSQSQYPAQKNPHSSLCLPVPVKMLAYCLNLTLSGFVGNGDACSDHGKTKVQ